MNRGFWDKLKKPIFVLAPMANVTDVAFRSIIARYGKPDVMWTEFVSVDGLLSPGKEKLLIDLKFNETERPIVAQIFGSDPEKFEQVAKMLVEMGFDGIDINMGCPVKKVINQKSCSALIRDPKRAQEIIEATKRGAGDLPVSVKTRIGFNKVEIDTWIPALLEAKPAALTIHLRTVKEMSKVPAHWELMPEIVGIVNSHCEEGRNDRRSNLIEDRHAPHSFGARDGKLPRPILLGNGDVTSLAEAEQKITETGCDGVMFGRAIFGNPWLFDRNIPNIPISERMRAMLEHVRLYEKEFRNPPVTGKNFELMKKHFKAYVNGFDGAKELRAQLMEAKDANEVERIVLEHYPILKEKSLV